ncbi:hypothetical protein ES705_30487 [subsurface metagenome]
MSREYTRRVSILGNIPVLGPVTLFDEFDDPIKWTKGGPGGDFIFEHDPNYSFNGRQSLHMKTRTTDSTANDIITATRYVHIPPTSKILTAFLFSTPDRSKIDFLSLELTYDNGITAYISRLVFLPLTPTWQYNNSAGVNTNIPESTRPLKDSTWHRIAFATDFLNNKHIHALINRDLFDLSSLDLSTGAGLNEECLYISLNLKNIGANPSEIYIDTILSTEF